MSKCTGCGAEIRGKVNGTLVENICRSCLPAYYRGELGEHKLNDGFPIKSKEDKKGKGFAKNAGVKKKDAKNLSVTVKLTKELYNKLLKDIEKTTKPMSAYIRDLIIEHYNKGDE